LQWFFPLPGLLVLNLRTKSHYVKRNLLFISYETSNSEFWPVSFAKPDSFCIRANVIKWVPDLPPSNVPTQSLCITLSDLPHSFVKPEAHCPGQSEWNSSLIISSKIPEACYSIIENRRERQEPCNIWTKNRRMKKWWAVGSIIVTDSEKIC
jgi:hypothetical protein